MKINEVANKLGRRLNIKIISFNSPMNRQGDDLGKILSERGHIVTLYQIGDDMPHDMSPGYQRIFLKIPGIFEERGILAWIPFIKGGLRKLRILMHAIKGRCDVVVALNGALPVGVLVSKLKKSTIIYYPLEIVENTMEQKKENYICEKYVKVILNVEKNRMNFIRTRLKKEIPYFIVPNAPRRGIADGPRGRLIDYLRNKSDYSLGDKIILWHGMYGPHSCLGNIIASTSEWPKNSKLVLMLIGHIPKQLEQLVHGSKGKVILVPPVGMEALFEWVRDASVGLLPYEDDSVLNWKYCSPQKMFDFLACGVPFIGSKRPLIEEVAKRSGAGICVNMKNNAEITGAIGSLLSQSDVLKKLSKKAIKSYENEFNYDIFIKPFIEHMDHLELNA